MQAMPDNVMVVDHPLVAHKLTLLRAAATPTGDFRRLVREISLLMGYEVLRDLPTEPVHIETPLEPMTARQVSGKKLCFISILRAGNGILDGMVDLVPSARIGHVGLYRDPLSHEPIEYYFKVPDDMDQRLTVVVDPMLATGHSAAAAVTRLKRAGAGAIKFVCLIAAPEGIAALHAAHPDVPVYTAAIDRQLDEHAYIRPGLGDAGDRLFGTK
ncbi:MULTISPECIES: uracil phosphoribosyltransferase [Acidiphilium]|jgi:uracil phosphoribosyltransferase|uniref:Uracil phosphoribosyltransferase n=2 Tax=Acidiphilium TaxID=522 RepID=A5FZR1_ACICJ|nr:MULTISPECIES: uracil phosphoribosyltransferase [Acidiphilium]ABQ31093.1 uracil phosphoribosyltransferase [Acidiphilium cryptum JF-5]EGO95764.1 Uracil phosphoribosyltransferase [Acidiphilium sp. PM]KDM65855.1 uracil phosphoribosyltransferase Upp [Acidiphilium sp. JA12-A1]MBS3023186.1 uracil phosphoribosyltransferase [Acidiphilium multivorum]UNC13479.1 uracil phosphoribosyltransferase [Acidiphilium multivorum]